MHTNLVRNKYHVSSTSMHAALPQSLTQVAIHNRVLVISQAQRRQMDRDYSFVELYQVVVEKLQDRNCLLVRDTYQLIECIKTPEQAARCLDIIAAHIKAQEEAGKDELDIAFQASMPQTEEDSLALGMFERDWHYRKRFLARIAEIAVLELNKPELVYAIIGNMKRFKISTYFGKDLIKQLGAYSNIPMEVLSRIAVIVQQQRGPSDKGSKAALSALLEVMQDRGAGDETLESVKNLMAAAQTAQPAKPIKQAAEQPRVQQVPQTVSAMA